MEAQKIWDQVKSNLKSKNPNNHFLHTWIEPVQVLNHEINEDSSFCFEILVPSELHKHWISENLVDLISSEISHLYPNSFSIKLQVSPKSQKKSSLSQSLSTQNPFPPSSPEKTSPAPNMYFESKQKASKHFSKGPLPSLFPSKIPVKKNLSFSHKIPKKKNLFHPQYTFSTFIVGKNNEFAQAASFHVSENPYPRPTENYNPLFIYGPTGMGKTHLLHAIGNHIQNKNPYLKIKYLSAETFLNDFISGIRRGEMDKFRKKYRDQCEFLLMDDIQVLKQGESSQEEFFHTLNHFFSHSRQVAFASDRMPKDMEGLQDRIRTRLEWGLIADIKVPDMETRMAILKYKAENMNLELSQDVALYLARISKRSIRELEGNLNKIKMFSELQGHPIHLDLARKLFSSHENISQTTAQQIQKIVTKHYKISLSDLKSKSRSHSLVLPRQVCMYLIKKHLNKALTEIGKLFGKKDHTTVLNAVKKIENLKKKHLSLQKDLEKLEIEIQIQVD